MTEGVSPEGGQRASDRAQEEVMKELLSAQLHHAVVKHWKAAIKATSQKVTFSFGRWRYSNKLIDWKTRGNAAKEIGELMKLYPAKELNVHTDPITDRTKKFMTEVDGDSRDKLPSELAEIDELLEKEEGDA